MKVNKNNSKVGGRGKIGQRVKAGSGWLGGGGRINIFKLKKATESPVYDEYI